MILRGMKQVFKYILFFQMGGLLYYYIEILFRGTSHWSMFLLGGLCYLFCSIQNEDKAWQAPLWRQVLRCVAFVTAGEFITGCMVNLWLGWNVWDYSSVPFNFMGQICLPYAFLFSGLCLVAILLDDYLRYFCFGEKKPSYYWLTSLKERTEETTSIG